MSATARGATRVLRAATLLLLAAACGGPRDFRVKPEGALAGFRAASPQLATWCDGAAAVGVFVDVEGTAEGCTHAGVLFVPDGEQENIVLRCLEEPRAPGGYRYHQLVVLRSASQVELLREGSLDLEGLAHLALPLDDHAAERHANATGWVVSTRRPQLLFGDQNVRQQLEP